MRILVVDDERRLRDVLRRSLTLAGYEVRSATDGYEGLAEISGGAPDAVVLDIGLPTLDGLEVCRRLRSEGNRVPVLMLTARDAVSDRVEGLDAGADDYLVKPFDVEELKARIRALVRRATGEQDVESPSFGELRLDPDRHGVVVGDEFVELTRTEFQLLELFMLNPRRGLPPNPLYHKAAGEDFGPAPHTQRVYTAQPRRQPEDPRAQD